MSSRRHIIVAYNDIAIGGEHEEHDLVPLDEGYEFSRSEDQVQIGVTFTVTGTGGSDAAKAADLATKIGTTLEPLRQINGNLVLQHGRGLELAYLVGAGSSTVTSVTGGFVAGDVGSWISIVGLGVRKITARNSSNSIDVDSAVAAATYDAILPSVMFKGAHSDRSARNARGSLTKVSGHPVNSEFTQVYSLTVVSDLPESNETDKPEHNSRVTVSYDAARRQVITIRASYKATSTDTAMDVYDDEATTFCEAHLDAFLGTSEYELTSEVPEYDGALPQGGQSMSFTRVYKERIVPDAATVVDAVVSVSRQHRTTHGLKGHKGMVSVNVSFACAVDQTVTTESGLLALYSGTIKSYLISRVTSIYGGGRVVVQSESVTPDPTRSALQVQLTVILPDKGSRIWSYQESVTITHDPGINAIPIWDGEDDTYALVRKGRRINLARQQSVKALGSVPLTPPPDIAAAGSIDRAGLVVGGNLATIFADLYKPTGDGSWLALPWTFGKDPDFIGKGIESGGSRITVYDCTFTGNWLWVRPRKVVEPQFRAIPVLELSGGSD